MLSRTSGMIRMQDFVGRYVGRTDFPTFHEVSAQGFQALELVRTGRTKLEVSN